jgi:transcriptional activator SPT7
VRVSAGETSMNGHTPSRNPSLAAQRTAGHLFNPGRLRTPNMTDSDMGGSASQNNGGGSAEGAAEEDPRAVEFRERYNQTQSRIAALFSGRGTDFDSTESDNQHAQAENKDDAPSQPSAPPKKAARTIDEDDYGDDDDDDEDDEEPESASPLQLKSALAAGPRALASPATPLSSSAGKPPLERLSSSDQALSSEEARKKAVDAEQAVEDRVLRNRNTIFYTLENDRVAMLEQQKLDELDRQVETEISGQAPAPGVGALPQQGSLSTANLGASSLLLRHLLTRIDHSRHMVNANDGQLRRLISEVRKNRSKWASEDKVNQEELYEAAENVLNLLKAMTEYAVPFLNKVSKREAPDYYNFIKNPMDIGTMMKKLKMFQYKSKKEFVDDLYLIWRNCLSYNTDPNHFLRKKALVMQRRTDELVVKIPDLVVRDRAEVEAEERRNASLDADLDGIEDSDGMLLMTSNYVTSLL